MEEINIYFFNFLLLYFYIFPLLLARVPAYQQASDPCGAPPSPSPLAFTLSYQVGLVVTYQCLQDHTPTGGDAQLRCENGAWSGQPLLCRSKYFWKSRSKYMLFL